MSDPAPTTHRLARALRRMARIVLILVCLFWGVFALLSGAQEAGGGVMGLLRNSPNALPWVVLAGLIALSFRYERVGGALIVAAGVFATGQYNAFQVWQTMLMIPLPLILSGVALVAAGTLDPRRRDGNV